jgi:type IV pilus assembly protein PilW
MKYEHTNTRRATERGFTLTEVMVAITLSVFLLMGLFTILQQTRQTSGRTTGISQLQDDERVAMTIMTDTIQAAGYVPEANGSGQSLFVADAVFATAGQILVAGTAGASVGERLTMRYDLAANDTTLTCAGTTNTGPEQVYKEIFQITTNAAGVNQLVCIPSNGSAAVPLVNNVANLKFQFAVNTSSASSLTQSNALGPNTEASHATGYGCPADTYIATANMSQWDWTNVCAVKVDIVFINPLYQPPGQPLPTPGQLQYISFERVIGILSKTGVNVTNSTQT